MIDDLSITTCNYFTSEFQQKCKRNTNITHSILSDAKRKIKAISIEGGLYLQIVMIRNSIVKGIEMEHPSVEGNDKEHSDDTPNMNDEDKDNYSAVNKNNDNLMDSINRERKIQVLILCILQRN